ncbi:hypothetical protein IGI04_039325 [Brassica rapa subsp. trilocularis]|uniref:NAB domain-containing protein n=1 Tax=Brassica rapa subsp. trilocularis TaxID=1813537 RepID=A0ABQ7KNA4_BRACM|nr:hypothetical protein IGI04_039325 [Brassica rapa subsp. trilocularis]
MVMDSSKWWWIGNHNTTNFSPWLHSTLSGNFLSQFDSANVYWFPKLLTFSCNYNFEELDEKTKEMLRVIDEDADSFAARAEMYYKKRPELVAMVQDFYRSHRSLAERYDLLRPSSVHRHGSEKSHREKSSTWDESSWSEACETHEEYYAESEVDDGEDKWVEDEGEETETSRVDDGMMKEEVERLREENKVYSEIVREKDEEKREAIRQMSLAIDMLKEENSELKRCVSSVVAKHNDKESDVSQRKQQMWRAFEFNKLEGLFGRVVGNWVVPKTESTTSRELMTL